MSGDEVHVQCSGCPAVFSHPRDIPLPDLQPFCPLCQKRIEDNIALNLMTMTGSPRGGIAIIDDHLIARVP